jgi:hypothetical protein
VGVMNVVVNSYATIEKKCYIFFYLLFFFVVENFRNLRKRPGANLTCSIKI